MNKTNALLNCTKIAFFPKLLFGGGAGPASKRGGERAQIWDTEKKAAPKCGYGRENSKVCSIRFLEFT